MSNAVYPAQIVGLAWTVNKTREHKTIVQPSPAEVETRIAQSYNPIWHWTLMYEWLLDEWQGSGNKQAYAPYTDVETLMGFTMARQGSYDDFLFDDPSDDFVGPAVTGSPLVPNTQAELQLFSDGGSPPTYYSPIQRNMGGLFWEDITDLNPANTISVYADATHTTDYSIGGPGLALPGYSFAGLYLQWHSQPATPITAQFNFYFRVRFEGDTTDFEQWAAELWTIGGESSRNGAGPIKLKSARTARI